MKNKTTFSLVLALILIIWTGIATELRAFPPDGSRETIFDRFQSQDVLKISLKTDISKLVHDKNSDQYQKAKLSYYDQFGNLTERKLKVKARGKYRRKVCDFPPLKLKFSKDDLLADGLMDDNKLKLVTHCMEDHPAAAQQDLLEEFLAYKMLNILTEKSFRVQLVQVTYIDSNDGSSTERYGFIIESTHELEQRLSGVSKKVFGLPEQDLEVAQYNTVAMFQYMIGNTDWSIRGARNVKFILPDEGSKVTLIPYDFDFSGVVNAEYAVIDPNYPVQDLRDRYFLGHFRNAEELEATLDLFRENKQEILSLCANFELLKKKNRRDIVVYLKSFFELIDEVDAAHVDKIRGGNVLG